MTGSVRRFLSSGSILIAGTAAYFVVGFAQNVMLARSLGTAGFGAWAIVAASWFLLHALFTQGAEEALLRELAAERDSSDRRRLRDTLAGGVRVAVLTRLVCAVLLVLGSFTLARFTDQPEAIAWAMRIQALTAVVDAVEPFWRCIMRDRERFVAIAAQPVLSVLAVLSLLTVLALAGVLTVPLVAACALTMSLGRAVVCLAMLRRELRSHYQVSGLATRALAVWRYPLAVPATYWQSVRLGLLSNFFAGATRHGDVLILMWFVGDTQLGLYRIARMMIEYAVQAVRLLGIAAFGDMTRMAQEGRLDDLVRFLRTSSLVMGGLALAAAPVLLLLTDDILVLFYGAAYAEAELPMQILVPSLLLFMTLFWTNELVYALRQLTFYTAMMATLLVVFVAVGWGLSHTYGIVGMAITSSATAATATVLTFLRLALWLRAERKRQIGALSEPR